MSQLVRRSLSETISDDDSSFIPPSPESQRWVSESETCYDSSPILPMSGRRRSGSEDHNRWIHIIMDKKQRTLLSRPGPFLDNEYCHTPPLPPQRWASKSEKEYIDEFLSPGAGAGAGPSSGSGRWAPVSCRAEAYKTSPPLLPTRRTAIRSRSPMSQTLCGQSGWKDGPRNNYHKQIRRMNFLFHQSLDFDDDQRASSKNSSSRRSVTSTTSNKHIG